MSAFPAEGFLPSEVLNAAKPQLDTLMAELPPGYKLAIGGEHEEQVKSFRNQARVMMMSTAMITVAATVIALIPLAMHGGPLWVPMCYAQIGGLAVATFVTLVLVPVIYAIFVKDLKLVTWETAETHVSHDLPSAPAPTAPCCPGVVHIGRSIIALAMKGRPRRHPAHNDRRSVL